MLSWSTGRRWRPESCTVQQAISEEELQQPERFIIKQEAAAKAEEKI